MSTLSHPVGEVGSSSTVHPGPPVPAPGPPNDAVPPEVEEAIATMPEEAHPTIAFIIPFPEHTSIPSHGTPELSASDTEKTGKRSKKSKKPKTLPPFLIYHPPAARLTKPPEGEKEHVVHKAQRKWEQEEDAARGKTGFKAKTVGLIGKGMSWTKNSGLEFLTRTPKKLKEIRLLYPASYPPEDLKNDFNTLIAQTKKGAVKSSIIATTLTPFALAFDTVTFIPGPFEICCVWASASWVGTARANAIANGVTSDKVPLNFKATPELLAPLTYRLHELVAHQVHKGSIAPPHWIGTGAPKRGPQLASIILELLHQELGEDLSDVLVDKTRLAEDIEMVLEKAAKEWAKLAKELEKEK